MIVEPKNLVRQGKYECGAAALAVVLGHSLFNVKRVLGSIGWRNDSSGVTDKQLRECAREFGRDLLYVGPRILDAMGSDVPACIVTVPSLNYKGSAHGVAWYDNEIVDPNFGYPNRKVYCASTDIVELKAYNYLILTKEPLDKDDHESWAYIRSKGSLRSMRDVVAAVMA